MENYQKAMNKNLKLPKRNAKQLEMFKLTKKTDAKWPKTSKIDCQLSTTTTDTEEQKTGASTTNKMCSTSIRE